MNDPYETVAPSTADPKPPVADTDPFAQPQQIGRYRIESILGEGGFGRVYLARDDQLNRAVAIKVPRPERLSRPEDAEAYLTEARTVASLDHPNIVPIFDVGTTPDGLCYVVSKVIEGSDLAKKMRQARLAYTETAELIATVAEALHHAHGKGLVHRDIKPGNILIDTDGRAYVADFGLALKEEDFGKGATFAGTPAYMSPEQARGEGHRVDGRSDIFSLGVVLYELLVGRRPFKADALAELLEQITHVEARPPRQVNDHIPKEMERICLKTLSKRASERYTTAKDLADDLRHFLEAGVRGQEPKVRKPEQATGPSPLTPDSWSLTSVPKIVPKGLRSFDANDADFFLELLPGPRDREGLPESIRFWKNRLEANNPGNTFSVGLLYGPSGCGKSSLVKAGLLPRLAAQVIAVYVEATAEETEARLLKGLRKQCPDLPDNLGVVETLAALRRGHFLPAGKKVVLVLDQFEQWLHAKRTEENRELVRALRHCDGERLQCVVMVRDDFWLAVSRFMSDIEIELVQGHNMALVDLFDQRHAKKVLAAFGWAFGVLPERCDNLTKEHEAFLDQAVAGLSQDGKIISVRLALFAEMVKGKPWTPATLNEVGGMEGVGLHFLEETFAAATAPAQHRQHQKAAQAVLKALLPDSGADIKGHMRAHAELLEMSGYGSRPRDFEALLRILDGELRLITPTDPEGVEGRRGEEEKESVEDKKEQQPGCSSAADAHGVSPSPFLPFSPSSLLPATRFYQLTHDYLVHSLRDWLTRKQKETKRGRAELLLADRAAVWSARPENRQLPSLWQWLSIRWRTPKKNWTKPQRKMMQQARRYHAVRGLVLAVLVALLGFAGYEGHGRLQAHALRRSLLGANTNEVPTIVADMSSYRRWIDPLLRDACQQAEAGKDARKQLHASLALLPVDATQVDYLFGRLLDAEPHEVPVIRDALAPHKDALLDKLWTAVEKPAKGKESRRLPAACALAAYDPTSPRWAHVQDDVANDLVRVPAVHLATWMTALRPVREKLRDPLAVVFRDTKRRETERALATDLLADYAGDQPELLAELVQHADEKQFAVLFGRLTELAKHPVYRATIVKTLTALVQQVPTKEVSEKEKENIEIGRLRARAALALLRFGERRTALAVLQVEANPEALSQFVALARSFGLTADDLLGCLDLTAKDSSARYGLLLALGDFSPGLSEETRKALTNKLQAWHRREPSSAIHAACEWLLRKWGDAPNPHDLTAETELPRFTQDRQWFVLQVDADRLGFVVFPPNRQFLRGSPAAESLRVEDENRHPVTLQQPLAVLDREVSLRQWRKFLQDKKVDVRLWEKRDKRSVKIDDSHPAHHLTWNEAVEFCRWLTQRAGMKEIDQCYVEDVSTPAQGDKAIPEVDAKKNEELFPAKRWTFHPKRPGFRLPTEAEWECACRAGATTTYGFGCDPTLLQYFSVHLTDDSGRTPFPGGTKMPNLRGLFDMHGNVWEWCQDTPTRYETMKEEFDPIGQAPINNRAYRGGSFDNYFKHHRTACRIFQLPNISHPYVGFRVVCTLPTKKE